MSISVSRLLPHPLRHAPLEDFVMSSVKTVVQRALTILALVIYSSSSAEGADLLRMNAAVPADEQRVGPDRYTEIIVSNALPEADYRINTRVETHEVALPSAAERQKILDDLKKKSAEALRRLAQPPNCKPLEDAVGNLKRAVNENEIAGLLRQIRLAKGTVQEQLGGSEACAAILMEAEMLAAATTRTFQTHLALQEGEYATAALYRLAADGEVKVAEKVFDTGPAGALYTTGVFGALRNRDQRWFTRAGDNDGEFIVTQEVDRRSWDPLASVLVGWVPQNHTSGGWQAVAFRRGVISGSFAAGLGGSADGLMVLAGYSFRLSKIGLAAGYAGYQRERLRGIYKGDGTDVVRENLTQDQLTEETFDGGWWIGLTWQP